MGGAEALLPEWLRWLWVAVYMVVVAVHLRHAASKGGQRRAWHCGHVVMAAGMGYMFLPVALKAVPGVAWGAVFAALACVILAWILRSWRGRRAVNLLWMASVIGMLAMVYMFLWPDVAQAPLPYALIAYFAAEMLAWLAGSFDELADRRRGLLPFALGHRSPEARASAGPLAGYGSVELRASLGAMAAGMAYMFLAMQIGM